MYVKKTLFLCQSQVFVLFDIRFCDEANALCVDIVMINIIVKKHLTVILIFMTINDMISTVII